MFVAIAILWILVGVAVVNLLPSPCVGDLGGDLAAAPSECLLLAGLALFIWSALGTTIGFVAYYWRLSRGRSKLHGDST